MTIKEGTKQNLRLLKQVVEEILILKPECRDSDKLLFIAVARKYLGIPFGPLHIDEFVIQSIPPNESITRCRRKIQEEMPNLKGSKKIQEARANKEVAYRSWSIEA